MHYGVRYINIESRLGWLSQQRKMLYFVEDILNRLKMNSLIQIIIKFSPLVLFIMLIFINREDKLQVIGFLGLLFLYTAIIVMRILYAKKVWHDEV